MSDARDEILGRVRNALRGEQPVIAPVEYRETASLNAVQRIDLFVDRLLDYGAAVHRCSLEQIPETVSLALETRGKRRILIPPDLPEAWLPAGYEWIVDKSLASCDLDTAEGVLTGCTAAIAMTGTIVLQNAPGQGRRAATLIPDYHLCVVHASEIVETVPECIRALDRTRPTTFISGPSATSDIEMTRIQGVHGPRTLEVVLVTSR